MIYPDIPKVLERRQSMYANRKYYLKASEVYATLRVQRGFAAVPGHKLRASIREQLTDKTWGYGRRYLSRCGYFHRPECDEQLDFGMWGRFQVEDATGEGGKVVTRYSAECVRFMARRAPFICPICGSDENPLKDFEYDFPYHWRGKQLVCLSCWQRKLHFIQNTPLEMDNLDDLIKKLNKEISNAEKRRSERRKAAKQLGGPGTERDVRHAGSENVADPCV